MVLRVLGALVLCAVGLSVSLKKAGVQVTRIRGKGYLGGISIPYLTRRSTSAILGRLSRLVQGVVGRRMSNVNVNIPSVISPRGKVMCGMTGVSS